VNGRGRTIAAPMVGARRGMTRSSKVLTVVALYAMAVLLAWLATHLYVVMTASLDRQSSAGMYAFGDSIFFLGIFGFAAIPGTCAALIFLRPVRGFWRVASVVSLAVASTALAAGWDYLGPFETGATSGFSPLRVIVAPLCALGFLLSAVFAPTRSSRIALLVAGVIEGGVFVSVASMWFLSSR
jgi:hypothetical protein